MQIVDGVRIWGEPDERTIAQAVRCAEPESARAAALMADAHLGYSMPIGGVVAYEDHVSPSGVGYDIACGIMAVRTNIQVADIRDDVLSILKTISENISFGLGRSNPGPIDHELFDDPLWQDDPNIGKLKDRAYKQLGTVGSGNHFVDLLTEIGTGTLWVAAHFGSRGFGHGVASGFLNLANGRGFFDKVPGESMDQPPTLLSTQDLIGQTYVQAMHLAGRYAYAGREYVITEVLNILGASATRTVHNHHNFAWLEEHDGQKVWVVRKGATPAFPGQTGFVGGSMCDIAAVVEGVDTKENKDALSSTVHGAGRIMSRSQAKGKKNKRGVVKREPQITRKMMEAELRKHGVALVGGEVDEAPFAYRKLQQVLDAHVGSINVSHTLKPIGVVMAGSDTFDPYKD